MKRKYVIVFVDKAGMTCVYKEAVGVALMERGERTDITFFDVIVTELFDNPLTAIGYKTLWYDYHIDEMISDEDSDTATSWLRAKERLDQYLA